MIIIYRILINIIIFFSPIIIFIRLWYNKEHPKRYKEKYGVSSKIKKKGKLIWFHGSSVGEILSILPIIEKLEQKTDIKQILVTSNTLSSSKVIEKFGLKKTIHQFFPIDSTIIIKKFLDYWQPSSALFVESEIWPNTIIEIKNRGIPLLLVNGRITKKSFKRWKAIDTFSRTIFSKFDLCLTQNNQTTIFLKNLGSKKILNIGNLKYAENINFKNDKINLKTEKFLNLKSKIFIAVSTHKNEEEFCAKLHKNIKLIYPNILTIIIPRHIDRVSSILDDINKYNLKIHLHSSKKIIQDKTDIYLVDTFGETKSFLKKGKIVFLGGSLIKHGGQNPLEAARYGCKIIHGPHIFNFSEVYKFLEKYNITTKINNHKKALSIITKELKNKKSFKNNQLVLSKVGKNILFKNYNELSKYI